MSKEKVALAKQIYEDRLVLFLDFLGFREIIKRTEQDERIVTQIVSAIDHIKQISQEREFYKTQCVTQFSDCVVISYQISEPAAVFDLVLAVGFMLIDLAGFGFLLRGAITSGKLLHTKTHLLGPAMVQAYMLEHEAAKYPRIIVDKHILEYAKNFPAAQNTSKDELRYVRDFLRKDTDNHLYIDYVTWKGVVEVMGMDADNYPHYLELLSRLIKDGLGHKDPKVIEKYLWLYERYMEAISHFRDTPQDHHGRYEYPEMYESILSLPRFNNEVRNARAIFLNTRRLRRTKHGK